MVLSRGGEPEAEGKHGKTLVMLRFRTMLVTWKTIIEFEATATPFWKNSVEFCFVAFWTCFFMEAILRGGLCVEHILSDITGSKKPHIMHL